jgi:formylglycine-generating enzyme required for sulfatase activity
MTEAPTYDLFISYAEADQAWVEGYLLDVLKQAGVRYHSEAAFALGKPRLSEFEHAIQHSQRILLVLSPAYLADNISQFVDVLAQSYGLETNSWPVIPLLLRPVKLPLRLAMLTALNATEPAHWPAAMERLCAASQRPVPGPAPRPPCPYPGMMPFQEDDHERFFGRDKEVPELLERLRLYPFLTVIGPSGSGKSSLVLAGLVPALRRSGLFGPGEWLVQVVRPGESPLDALTGALHGNPTDPARTVSELLAARPNARRLLLVIDQFEELFTLARLDTEAFQQALLRLTQVPHCYVLLTVRADFYPDLMATPLWREIQAHRTEVLPLDKDGLGQAIVRPAQGVGVFVEDGLVERLLADAVGEPGVLPLVQETLVLLWERLEQRFLPLHAYEALGGPRRTGLQVAMARRADAALADLTPVQQAMARRVFMRLVQFGEGRADTRRQQAVTALRAADDDPALFDQTLRRLVDCRLLTLAGEEQDADRKTDIAHEALINGWPALQGWLEKRREAEQTRRQLEAKAIEWERLGRGSGGLLDEVELAEAERWLSSPDATDLGYTTALLALAQDSRAALERSEAEKEATRQRELALERRARRQLQGLVIVLGLLVLFGVSWLVRQEVLRQWARVTGELRPVPGLNVTFERYEVTNVRYARCVQAGQCREPPMQLGTYFQLGAEDRPVTGIDAMQAADFCRWLGRRLPTHAEWLHAATQGGRTTWPWGNEPDPTSEYANLLDDSDSTAAQPVEGQTWAVGSRPLGATPEGIHDLIGNVWEWTATPWEKPDLVGATWDGIAAHAPARLIMEGGSYQTTISGLGTEDRPIDASVSFRTADLGFRCVEGGAP